jgi:hypothetical protein
MQIFSYWELSRTVRDVEKYHKRRKSVIQKAAKYKI